MEVAIHDTTGLPDGAILSVRAGSTRRQAPVPLAGPLRFPNLPFNAKHFKVDVMSTLGSAKVEIDGQKEMETYSVAVDIGGGRQARVGFSVREEPSLCGKRACELKQVDKGSEVAAKDPSAIASEPVPAEKVRAAHDTRAYARDHNIPNLVQEMLQHILREKPDAPFSVMSAYFKRKAEEMGEKPMDSSDLPPQFLRSDFGSNSVGHTLLLGGGGAENTLPPQLSPQMPPKPAPFWPGPEQSYVSAGDSSPMKAGQSSPMKAGPPPAPPPVMDPERRQLEGEHMSLMSERASLLRELEMLVPRQR